VRDALGLQEDDRLLLMMGRIEFWQKRHDLAVEALASARARGSRLHLLVVGSGPDEPALRGRVRALGLEAVVHWRPWQSDVGPFYAACDRLLLPSRYEGVPLVMLEALSLGRQVLAANVDGMADMLPPAWLFAAGDGQALTDALCAPEHAEDAAHRQRLRELITTRHTIRAFCERFHETLRVQLDQSD
jgi:glycosyltransferase involved in cell wall biosynthesis